MFRRNVYSIIIAIQNGSLTKIIFVICSNRLMLIYSVGRIGNRILCDISE